MAYLLFNPEGLLQCSAKHKEDLNLIRGDIAHYESNGLLKEVSDDDYKEVACNEKSAVLQDGNIVYGDSTSSIAESVDDMPEIFETEKNIIINMITKFKEKHSVRLALSEFSDLNTRIDNYKTALENLNPSSMTFTATTSFLRHWFDNQSVEPITHRYLQ